MTSPGLDLLSLLTQVDISAGDYPPGDTGRASCLCDTYSVTMTPTPTPTQKSPHQVLNILWSLL